MFEARFWEIIALLRGSECRTEAVVEELMELPRHEITYFDDLLAQKLHAIDTREHARYMYEGEADVDNGNDYISPDEFLYRRCAVVLEGRAFYERVLANPRLLRGWTNSFEPLLSMAREAFETKFDRPYVAELSVSFESFMNGDGWKRTPETTEGLATGVNVPTFNRRPT